MSENALLVVRVTPRSARDEILGYAGGTLRIRLRAPPVEGQANDSLVRLLADRLGIPIRDIDLVSGATSRTKHIRINGISLETALERLTHPPS